MTNATLAFQKFRTELTGYVRKRIRDPDDADDIVQTIFLKLLAVSGPITDLRAYVFQAARNALTEHWRREENERARLEQQFRAAQPASQTGDAWSPVDSALSEDDEELTREIVRCVSAFAQSLPDAYREVVLAADFESIPQKKIAERLGQPYSSVKSRVQEGRRRIRQSFLNCCRIHTTRAGDERLQLTPRESAGPSARAPACAADCASSSDRPRENLSVAPDCVAGS